jgi:hypothetical protein
MDEQDDDVTQPKRPAPKRPDQSRLKVTKEELDKSGLSLRDYMNKQLGLKRRDGSAPAPAPAPAGSQVKSALYFDPAARSSEPLEASLRESQRKQRESDASGEIAKTNAKLEAANKAQSQGSSSIGDSDWAKSVRASQANGDSGFLGKRMREAMGSKYAKGGKVSASSRGDGIAQRGKTRGKLC